MESDAAVLVLRPALKTGFSEMGWGSTPLLSAKFNALVAQLVEAAVSNTVECEFESHQGHQFNADVAQLVEQRIENPCVTGSIPVIGTKVFPLVAQW